MATLNRLVQVIGHFDHRGPRAIGRLAYALGEAGLIRVGRTGGAAIRQDPGSAANLLLGIASQEPPVTVARAVESFAAAKARSCNWHVHGQDGCDAFDAIADARTLHEALVTALEVAPEFVFLAENRARTLHPRSAEAAFDAAIRGLVIDVRVAMFRPQGVACIRLVDSTGERGPVNLASIWFDAAKLDPLPPGGSAVTVTSEFGLSLIGPVAFELRDFGSDDHTHRGGAGAPAKAPAVGAAPSGMQRRETRQTAPFVGVDSDG